MIKKIKMQDGMFFAVFCSALLTQVAFCEDRYFENEFGNEFGNKVEYHHKKRHGNSGAELPWDFFMLVANWPQSACESMKVNAMKMKMNKSSSNYYHHHHHHCVIPAVVNNWVLHGLWPSSSQHTQQPFYCHEWKFDFNKIKDIESSLLKYWPNLFADTSLTSFWKHEYEKHGTCAASVKGFEDEHEYFQRAMELLQKYDLMRALADYDIVPREDPYKLSQIKEAIANYFGKEVCIECSHSESIGQLLSGGYVCLNKGVQLIDCKNCEHRCYDDEDIFYHPIKH